MTDLNLQILKLIQENKTINEISEITKLSNRQLYQRLNRFKLHGYNFDRNYSYLGDIKYILNKELIPTNNEVRIDVPDDITKLKTMLISDIHLGCDKEGLNYLNQIYDYCINKGIHIIINAGDLINGSFGFKNKIDDLEQQVRYLLKNYPFDKNILNFACLGNHDLDSLNTIGLNLIDALINNRHDIVPLGYANGFINIKHDKIYVYHKIKNIELNDNKYLTIKGHKHKTEIFKDSQSNVITLPPLSDVYAGDCMPGAMSMTLSFNQDYFSSATINQLIIHDNKVYNVNEITLSLSKKQNKDTGNDIIAKKGNEFVNKIIENPKMKRVNKIKKRQI